MTTARSALSLPPAFPPPRGPGPVTVYDYGLIGNLATAALISRYGTVDWACLPRFASPSAFARLLDADRGGTMLLAPVVRFESEQTYLPSSNVLLTRFFLSAGRQLDLLDFMPVLPEQPGSEIPMIVRIAEARGGPIPIRYAIEPRLDYGATPVQWEPGPEGYLGSSLSGTLWAGARTPLVAREGVLHGRSNLAAGERTHLELAWGAQRPIQASSEELLRATIRYWQSWVHPPTTPIHRIAGLWHSWVERSELVLKLLSSESTGLFIAAPTTSLPEWPGGSRNWDYRFVWVRDAAFSAQALLLLGHLDEAERFLTRIVSELSFRDPEKPLHVIYGADGESEFTERELPELAGFLESRPVRVGNAARQQFQLDIYGEILDAAHLLAMRRPSAVSAYYPRLVRLVNEVTRLWKEPDHGIWEVRKPPAHYVHSKLMAWVALDRAVDLAQRFHEEATAERWIEVREEIRTWILEQGYDPQSRSFVQAAGAPTIDAANLRIPLVGFLPYTDHRVRGTIRRVQRELGRGPFLYRYPAGTDGLDGPEGTFLPAAFWLVECLARLGQRQQAYGRWRRLLWAASPLGLYPEEYDPVHRRPLGNYPQAFTHIGVLRAAVALGATEAPSILEPALLKWRRARGRAAGASAPTAGPGSQG